MQSPNDHGSLNTIFAPHRFVGDGGTFITKSGELAIALKQKGIDYECLTDSTLEDLRNKMTIAESAFDEDYRTYQYLIKEDAPALSTDANYDNPVVNETVNRRAAFLNEKNLSRITLSRVILYNPTSLYRPKFNTKRSIRLAEASLNKQVEILQHQAAHFRSTAKITGAEIMTKQEVFTFLRYLSSLQRKTAEEEALRYDDHLDYWMCSRLFSYDDDEIRISGTANIRVLTMRDAPKTTFPNVLRELLSIRGNFILCSEYHRLSVAKALKMIGSAQEHFDMVKFFKNLPSAIKMAFQRGQTTGIIADEGAKENVTELGELMKQITNGGQHLGEYSFTAVVHDDNAAMLDHTVSQMIKVVAQAQGSLVPEDYWAPGAYLGIIPGTLPKSTGLNFRQRQSYLMHEQHADLSLIYSHHEGNRVNEHLGSEYLIMLETRDGTPYYLNLHERDLLGGLIFGIPGSGKTVLANAFIDHGMKQKPRTLILDGLGSSYRMLTTKHGGNYFELDPDGEWPFTLNPFLLPPSRKTTQYLSMLVRVCMVSGGFKPNAESNQIIYDEVKRVLTLPESDRRISSLTLPPKLRVYLNPWVGQGQYAFLFDNAIDTFHLSEMQTIDFSAMDGFADLLQPLLFHFFYLWGQVVYDPALLTVPKWMWVDEGWKMISYPAARRYIKTAGRTWRKRNGGFVLLTQSMVELKASKMLDLINELCPTKMLLYNPGGDFEEYARIFKMNEKEVQEYRGLEGKGDLLLKTPQMSKVLRCPLDEMALWTYANDPYHNSVRDKAIAEHGFTEGLKMLAGGAIR